MSYLEELKDPGFIESVKESCYEVLSHMQRDNIKEMIDRFKARKVSFYYWNEAKECGCFIGTYAYLEGALTNDALEVENHLRYHTPFMWSAPLCPINGFFANYIKDALYIREREYLDMVIGWMESYLTLLVEEDNA